ncbi:MAG: aminoacetone oxidase family FAD-binding enzyme, partial [Pseudomonadota bacterium]
MHVNCLIIGAGAAGMMCAAQLGDRALVIDHAKAPGEKIRISGGGRCNFTNMEVEPARFLSANPHFAKSALARYTQWDFIDLVARHGIAYHEKTLGQLFCDDTAKDIIAMLRAEMGGAQLWLQTSLIDLRHDGQFVAELEKDGQRHVVTADHFVVACGGKSIPKMGATGRAYDIAAQFGLSVTDTRPALVPFTFPEKRFAAISGVSAMARVSNQRTSFDEGMLFTHRGLSGPSILQISSYWRDGEEIIVDLIPDVPLADHLKAARAAHGKRQITTEIARYLPARLVDHIAPQMGWAGTLGSLSDARIDEICTGLRAWHLRPGGSEGYRTAEVTLGGVDTDALSSKTMEVKGVPGLYFIGEAVDVTGWLGG